jgi:hypothetical protein
MAIIQWALSKMPTTMIETPRTKPKKIQAIDADFLLRNSVDPPNEERRGCITIPHHTLIVISRCFLTVV